MWPRGIGADWLQQPNPKPAQQLAPRPPAPREFFGLGLGLFGGFGHYFMVRAFELAPAPFVSPFNYGQLIGATVLSVVVFGQLPDVWVWAGALVIAGSGVLMLWAERHVRRQLPAHSI